jgi:hypothetical protein
LTGWRAIPPAPPRRSVRGVRVVATIAAVRKSKIDRVKALPWPMLLQAGVVVGKRWSALSEKDRARLTRLVRESRGRVGNLSVRDRSELHRLSRKLDLKSVGRELLPLLRGLRRRRKRR